jgi:hypothetical protein
MSCGTVPGIGVNFLFPATAKPPAALACTGAAARAAPLPPALPRRCVPHTSPRRPVRQLRDHAQVMRDEHQPEHELAPQAVEEIKDLLLHRDVQCRGWLVGNQQFGASSQSHGDHRALPQASGKLVGKLFRPHSRLRHRRVAKSFQNAAAHLALAEAWLVSASKLI